MKTPRTKLTITLVTYYDDEQPDHVKIREALEDLENGGDFPEYSVSVTCEALPVKTTELT